VDVQWEVLRHLDETDVREVGVLVEQVTETDGTRPLSEHVMLHLRYGGDVDVRHVLARSDGRLVGYAHLDVTDKVAGSSAELAVTPDARRQGVGHGMVQHLLDESPDGRLRLWSHGEQGCRPLAVSLRPQPSSGRCAARCSRPSCRLFPTTWLRSSPRPRRRRAARAQPAASSTCPTRAG
jgi:mycothiol synthase